MHPTSRLAARAAALATLALLASCGGGSSDTSTTTTEAEGRAKALSFTPAATIPADANLNGMWSPVYAWPVISVHSVLLPDGRLMTYGSDLSGLQTGHANVDVWDSTGSPADGHLSLPNNTGTDIFCSSQLVLPAPMNAVAAATDKVFIAGGDVWTGTQTTNGPNNNSNLFDTASNTLARGNNMNAPRWYSSSITLVNGETYIQGGSGGNVNPEIRGLNGQFRTLTGIATNAYNSSFPRNFVAPDGRVFGFDPNSGAMYTIDPTGNGGLTLASTSFNAATTGSWTSSAAMYRPGHVLQFGGNANGAYTLDFSGNAPVAAATQSMAAQRQWANATILADGRVVATSGSVLANNDGNPTNYVETWDPVSAQWSRGPTAQRTRMYHSNAILLPDASVLVSGGGAGQPTLDSRADYDNLNAEVYYPPYLFTAGGARAVRPTIDHAPAWIDIGKSFGIDIGAGDAGGVSRVTLVKTGSTSHSFNMEQRFLDLPFTVAGSHVTIQAPSRAGEAPPGHYLLFVFDSAGVPSVGKIVSMDIAPAVNPTPQTTPVIANPGAQTLAVGAAAALRSTASEPSGATLAFSAAGLPPGLAIDPASGQVSGVATAPGTYYTVIAASDGVSTASADFVWTVQGTPVVLATPAVPAFVMANGTATYTASASGGSNLVYQWNFGDGSATTAWSASPTATHAYAAAGQYHVTVAVRNGSGALQSRSFTQVVTLPPTAKRPAASTNLLVETPAVGNPRLWVVNQDNDSVSVFDAVTQAKLGEVGVGSAPRTLALAPNGLLWVVNKRAATISVVDTTTRAVTRTVALARGSQPFGIVVSPDGKSAYVALEAGGRLLRFDTASAAQTASLAVGANVRHLAISGDGATLYASRFITPPLPGESTANVAPTAATGGELLQIATATMTTQRTIVLQYSTRPDAENQGRGIPNYLGAAAISPDGTQAWVPGKQDNVARGGLRDGNPLNFQNTVRAVSSRIVLASGTEDLARRIDHDNSSLASAATFDASGAYLFVALETSRELAVIDAYSGTQLFRVDTGRAPEGVALSADGRTLYVGNFMDRSVGVYDLGPLLTQGAYALPLVATLNAVATEALSADVLAGKQFFYDARDTRLARDNYMSCAACHDDGGHDGRVWDLSSLGEGLRNTIALRGRAGMGHGFLHWSNNFDEVQDFEGQIRALAGGTGLMSDAAFNAGTRSNPLGDTKAGVSADLDRLAAYLASLASFDPAPQRPAAATLSAAASAGRLVFGAQNCASCHSGQAFTGSGQNTLVDIGTLKPTSGKRLGGTLTGIDVPTLRDVWATAPYLHDGSAPTLEAAVLAHRGVAVAGTDLTNLTQYLREIGADEPAAVPTAGRGTGLTGSYYANATLSGTPVLTRTEAVDFNWAGGSPGASVPVDHFSARWSGTLTAPATGTYIFQTVSDDGVRVSVNGARLIDDWNDHASTTDTSAGVNLAAGQSVPIVVEYYENGGAAVMQLAWITPGNTAPVPIPASALGAATGGLTGSYFGNMTLAGSPLMTRVEAVNLNLNGPSPGGSVPANQFSVRWTGSVVPTTSGAYRFQTISDDGIRLWVNGVQVINDWNDHAATTDTSGMVTLTAGQAVSIRLEFYQNAGAAIAQLGWIVPGSSTAVLIPATALTP